MTNTLKIPERNLLYYKLFREAVEVCLFTAMAFIGYVMGMFDFQANVQYQFPNMTQNTINKLTGMGAVSQGMNTVPNPQFNLCFVAIASIFVISGGLALLFYWQARKGIVGSTLQQCRIALMEERIDEILKELQKDKGKQQGEIKRIDEIDQLMKDKLEEA
jgi:hypothetical protein